MISPLRKDSGFRIVVEDSIKQMRDGELQLVAASLSFSTMLALIPFVAVVLAILNLVGGGFEVFYPKVEHLFLHNLRETVGLEAARTVRSFLDNINAGKVGTTGAIFLTITSLRLLRDMESGVHRIWNYKVSRRFYKRLFFYWGLMLAIPLALAVYVSLLSLEEVAIVTRHIPKPISDLAFVWGGLFIVYRWVPEVHVSWRAATISSALTAVVLYIAQRVLTYATVQLFNYNKIYGSFAAIPILLIWLLTIWYIILGGVAFCASLQKRKGHFVAEDSAAAL